MDSQVKMLFPHWPERVKWFVIGGPACELEAQAVHQQYPAVRCIGFEPNRDSAEWQRQHGFPGEVHPVALWENDKDKLTLSIPTRGNDSGSVCRPENHPEQWPYESFRSYPVDSATLDTLSDKLGPFEDAVLWLDIEYAELPALRGAERLLDRTLMVNLETFHHRYLPEINRLLDQHGLILRMVWNIGRHASGDAQDYLYVRKELWK